MHPFRVRAEVIFFILVFCFSFYNVGCSATEITLTPTLATSPNVLPLSPTPTNTSLPTPTSTVSPAPSPTQTSLPQSGSDSIGDPYAPELGNTGYDVQSYRLKLELHPGRAELIGIANLRIESLLDQLVRFSLDFAGFEIDRLMIDGVLTAFDRHDHKLYIELPIPKDQGEILEIEIAYQGAPLIQPSPYLPFLGHLGMFFPGGSVFTLSEPDGAHFWFPCNNHPRDKAYFRFELTVPDDLIGVANGVLIETSVPEEGKKRFVWEHNFPMAPYLAVVAVGNYNLIETTSPGGIPIRHYVHPDLEETFLQSASITGEALDWMVDLYGPYPFEAFGFVTSRLVSMASETQTMVVLPETSINEETVIHEIAHMWFGNWVSLDTWGDMWLKEGAAIYTYLMWQTRHNPDSLEVYMRDLTVRVKEKSLPYRLNDLPKSQLLGYDSYWRGTVLFNALRLQVGDEAFFSGLRSFLQDYGGESASLDDFRQVMENASRQPLEAFFQEWLN